MKLEQGIGRNTPVKSIELEDYAVVNIKLIEDEMKRYFYMQLPIYEFTSDYGINMNAVIMVNKDQDIKVAYTYQIKIQKETRNKVNVVYPDGHKESYVKDGDNYVNKTTKNTIEEIKEGTYKLNINGNYYHFEENELVTIELRQNNGSTTKIEKTGNQTTIENSSNNDVVEIQRYENSTKIQIIRERIAIKSYLFSYGESTKELSIHYYNVYSNEGQNEILNVKIATTQEDTIQVIRRKQYVENKCEFKENQENQIIQINDNVGNQVTINYEEWYSEIKEEIVGSAPVHTKVYYDNNGRTQAIENILNKQFTYYHYNQDNLVDAESIPIYYNDEQNINRIQKNTNYIDSYTLLNSEQLTIEKSGIGNELISFVIEIKESTATAIKIRYVLKDKNNKSLYSKIEEYYISKQGFNKLVQTIVANQDYDHIVLQISSQINASVHLFNSGMMSKYNYDENNQINSILARNQITYYELKNKKVVRNEYAEIEYEKNYVKRYKTFMGIISEYEYDSYGNVKTKKVTYGDQEYQENYQYDKNNQILFYKNSLNNEFEENTYEYNSYIKSIESTNQVKINYQYPKASQPYFNQINFDENGSIYYQFTYENEAIKKIENSKSSQLITITRNINNEIENFKYNTYSLCYYEYYSKNNVLTHLVFQQYYELSDTYINYHYDEQLEKLLDIEYGYHNGDAQKICAFEYKLNDDPYALTKVINFLNETNDQIAVSQYYYTNTNNAYRKSIKIETVEDETNNEDGTNNIEYEVNVYADKSICGLNDKSLIRKVSNFNAINFSTLVSNYRNDLNNYKVCDFSKEFEVTLTNNQKEKTSAVLYNYLVPVSYFYENDLEFKNYVGIEIIDNKTNQITTTDNQNNLHSLLLSRYSSNNKDNKFTHYAYDLYFPFDSPTANTPFDAYNMSLIFMFKLQSKTSYYKTIIACLSQNENPLNQTDIETNLFLLYESESSKKNMTFSLVKGYYVKDSNSENSHIVFDPPLCQLTLPYNEGYNCIMIRKIKQNTNSRSILSLHINEHVVQCEASSLFDNVYSVVFGLRYPFEMNTDQYIDSYHDASFYITNIMIPYKRSITNEEFISFYCQVQEALNFSITSTPLNTTITHFDIVSNKHVQYISLDKNLISNDNLQPKVDLFEAIIDENDNIFHYDYLLKRNVLILCKQELVYKREQPEVLDFVETSGFSFSIKARLPQISTSEFDLNDYFNLISFDCSTGVKVQILFNPHGRIKIIVNNEKFDTNYYLSSQNYTNFVMQVSATSLLIYGNQNKIISIIKENNKFYFYQDMEYQFIIGYNQIENNQTSCYVSDFYIIDDAIPLDDVLKLNSLPNYIKHQYQFDSLLSQSDLYHQNTNILTKQYIYSSYINSENQKEITNLILKEKTILFNKEGNITYNYDVYNNVTDYYNKLNNTKVTYTYDSFYRLIKEEYYNLDYDFIIEVCEYIYDALGNIIEKNITTPESRSFKKISYTYDVYERLTYYDGKRIRYDDRNPYLMLSYDTDTFEWVGNRLIKYKTVDNICEFSYNEDGYRIIKKNFSDTIYYFYDQGVLIYQVKENQESKEKEEIVFLYDDTQQLIGFCHQNKYYYYLKDALNNINGIIDNNSTIVALYQYKAYGTHKVLNPNLTVNNDANFIGHINPIRYKGYYFDEESKLYYCLARYYSPELGRFISPDSIDYLDYESISGLNLFAYCGNNPIMYADPSGCFPILACILGLTALVGMGLTIGGVAGNNNLMTAIGLTMVAIPALISGGMALYCAGAAGTMAIGGITAVAGVGTGLFASAEYQEAFTGNNWMLDAGMSEEWYNGLMLATAAIATAGTVASMVGVTRYQNFGNSNWHGGWRKMRSHFLDHGKPQMEYKNVFDYTNGAKAIINNGGVYASKVNAYVQWIADNKYFFVGVGRNSNLITTYFIKTIKYAKYLSIL